MKPRLLTSKKWTPFPEEYLEQIRQVVSEAFAEQSEHQQVIVEGRIYPQELLIRVGFLEDGRLKQNNFEASIEYDVAKDNVIQTVATAMDAISAMIEAYFESQDSDEPVQFPEEWKPFEFLKRTIYLQYTTENTKLEAEADRLLGLDAESDSLVLGPDDEDDNADLEFH